MNIGKSKETNCTYNVENIVGSCLAFFSQFIAPYNGDCVLSLPRTRQGVHRHQTSSSTSTRRGRMVCWTSTSSLSLIWTFVWRRTKNNVVRCKRAWHARIRPNGALLIADECTDRIIGNSKSPPLKHVSLIIAHNRYNLYQLNEKFSLGNWRYQWRIFAPRQFASHSVNHRKHFTWTPVKIHASLIFVKYPQ